MHFSDVVSALDLGEAAASGGTDFDEAIAARVERLESAIQCSSLEDFGPPLLDRLVRLLSDELGREVGREEVQRWLERRYAPQEEPNRSEGDDQHEREILREEWPQLTRSTTPAQNRRAPLVVTEETAWPGASRGEQELADLLPKVFLVERLREVRALRGFRRIAPDSERIPPDLGLERRQRWLPAIEVFGEGIFLEFSIEELRRWEAEQHTQLTKRLQKIRSKITEGGGVARRFASELTVLARFIALHTFSHVLMRQLCYECGYGGASIRERLYVFPDKVGLLIYTAEGDSEGSLGGLVRQGRADRLGRTVLSSIERAAWCSNDPICGELPEHGLEGLNRAACHACCLAPETSCTHLNLLLDRELLVGDGTRGVRGLFQPLLTSESSDGSRT